MKQENMCRNIKGLFNFNPPATNEEIHIASLQYIRKISGYSRPSRVNEEVFFKAVERIEQVTTELLNGLQTKAKPKDREIEAEKAKRRFEKRNENLKKL